MMEKEWGMTQFHAMDQVPIELHYHSERPGLAPMVVGMIKGLAARFDVPVLVEQVESRTDGADHDVFRVREDSPKE